MLKRIVISNQSLLSPVFFLRAPLTAATSIVHSNTEMSCIFCRLSRANLKEN